MKLRFIEGQLNAHGNYVCIDELSCGKRLGFSRKYSSCRGLCVQSAKKLQVVSEKDGKVSILFDFCEGKPNYAIIVVKQKSFLKTFRILIHELLHFLVFKFVPWGRLHLWIDRLLK